MRCRLCLLLSLLFLLLSAAPLLAANTHGTPDTNAELRAWFGDLHTGAIVADCLPAVPSSSLTVDAFACRAYVATSAGLRYVSQAASPVGPLSGGNGTYWLAVHADTRTAVGGWTRQVGTHYLWQKNSTRPTTPADGLLLAQVTVAGSVITAVMGAGTPFSVPPSRLDLARSVREFGAQCDDTTNDAEAIQQALSLGGVVTLPPGATCLVQGADLTLPAGTHLHLPAGSTLHLDASHLTAFDVNNITLTGPGAIHTSNPTTTYPAPGNCWAGGGGAAVSIGGSTTGGTFPENIVIDGLEVYGDWSGTPNGTLSNSPSSYHALVQIHCAKLVRVINSHLHHNQDEILKFGHGGGSGKNQDYIIAQNHIHDCNHDCINPDTVDTWRGVVTGNTIRNGFTGIEALSGTFTGNSISDMVNTCFTNGGNISGQPSLLTFQANQCITADGVGVSIDFTTAVGNQRPEVVFEGNLIADPGTTGVILANARTLTFTGNTIRGYGRLGAGRGLAAYAEQGTVRDNTIGSAGASGTEPLNLAGVPSGKLSVGPNAITQPGTITTTGLQTPYLTVASQPVLARFSAANTTATTSAQAVFTKTLQAKSLLDLGGVRVTVFGHITGTNDTKTITLTYGGSTVTSFVAAAPSQDQWLIEGYIFNQGATNLQTVKGIGYLGTAIATQNFNTLAIDSTVDKTVTLTVTLANASDVVTVEGWLLEPLLAVRGTD